MNPLFLFIIDFTFDFVPSWVPLPTGLLELVLRFWCFCLLSTDVGFSVAVGLVVVGGHFAALNDEVMTRPLISFSASWSF